MHFEPGKKYAWIKLTPAVLVIAAGDGIREVSNPGAESPQFGVLVDLQHSEVRLSAPDFMRSTFNKLMNLDGGHGPFFEKILEESGYRGARVTLWKINWQALEALDQ